jgi:hypothetical protein
MTFSVISPLFLSRYGKLMQIAQQAAITEKLHKLNWLRTIQ